MGIGFTNYSISEREENDFYSTDPRDVEKLLERESFEGSIWEPACGNGAISKVLEKHYPGKVLSSDLIDRGYGNTNIDFLTSIEIYDNIITNPPYKNALEFVQQALKLSNKKVVMFLKLVFLEGQKRYKFFQEYPPKKIYVFSYRATCWKNGIQDSKSGTTLAHAWFVWEKGHAGKPEIEWII